METDILGIINVRGKINLNIFSLLVLSVESKKNLADYDYQPDFVVESFGMNF